MESKKSLSIDRTTAAVTVKTVSGRKVLLPYQEASYSNLKRVAMMDLQLEHDGLKLVYSGTQLGFISPTGSVDLPHPDLVPGAVVVAVGVRAQVRTPSTARSNRPPGVSPTLSVGATPSTIGRGSRSPAAAPFVSSPPPGATSTGPLCFPHAPEGLTSLALAVSKAQSNSHRFAELQVHATMAEIRRLTNSGAKHDVLKEILAQAAAGSPSFVEMCKDHSQLFVDAINGVTDRGLSVQEMMEAFALALDGAVAEAAGGQNLEDETLMNVVQQLFQPGGGGALSGELANSPLEEFLLPQLGNSANAATTQFTQSDNIDAATTEEEEAQAFSALQGELESAEERKDGLSVASVFSRVALFHQQRYTLHSESWSTAEEAENRRETLAAFEAACGYSVKLVEKRALEQLQGGNSNEDGKEDSELEKTTESVSTPAQQQRTFTKQTGGGTTVSRSDPTNNPTNAQSLDDEFYTDILASFVHGVFQPALTYFTQAGEREDKHHGPKAPGGSMRKEENLHLGLQCLLRYSYAVSQVLSPQGVVLDSSAPVVTLKTPDFSAQADSLLASALNTKTHLVIYSPIDVESATSTLGTVGAWVITPFTRKEEEVVIAAAQLHFVSCPCILEQYNAAATTLFHPSFTLADAWTSKAQEVFTGMVQPLLKLIIPEQSGAPLSALHPTSIMSSAKTQTGEGGSPLAGGGETDSRSHVPIVHLVTPSVFEFSAFPLASLVDPATGQPLVASCAVQQSLSLESVLLSAATAAKKTPAPSTVRDEGKEDISRDIPEDVDEVGPQTDISTTIAVQGAERPAWLSHNLKRMLNATVQRDQPYASSPNRGKESPTTTTIASPGERKKSAVHDDPLETHQTILHTSNPGSLREMQQAVLLVAEEFHPNLLRPEAAEAFNYLLTRFAVQGNTVPSQQCYEVIRGFYVGLSHGLPMSVALRRGLMESHRQHPGEPWRWGRWILLMNNETAGSRQQLRFLAKRCQNIRQGVQEVRKKQEATRGVTVRGSKEFRYLSTHGVGNLFESMLQHLLHPTNPSGEPTRQAESHDEVLVSLIKHLEENQVRLTNESAASLSASQANDEDNGVNNEQSSSPAGNSDHSLPTNPQK